MKKRILQTTLALTLTAGTLFGSVSIPGLSNTPITIGTQTVHAEPSTDVDKLIENLKSLQGSASSVMKGDPTFTDLISGTIDSVKSLGALYNSGTMFLKMAGIMKDPTAEKLMDIQYTLKDMSTTMSDMNMELKGILDKLQDMDVFQRETERSRKVDNCLNIYSSFCTNYQEKLVAYLKEYNSMITTGLRDWYKDSRNSRTGINIFFALDDAGQKIQVFNYSDDADPDCSVEGYKILKDETVRFSKESVDRAMQSASTYDVNTLRKNIITCMEQEIAREITDGTLDAGKAFFERWETLSLQEKTDTIVRLAEEAYNSLTSGISKKQMENSNLSTNVASKFIEYCDHITAINPVIDAELTSLYMTHGFEGEVKDAVNNVIDSINMNTGVFATMTLSMMHQSGTQTTSDIQQVLDHWTEATGKVENAKKTALHGYDNYCYITNSLVNYDERTMEYDNSITTRFDNSTTTYKSNACHTTDILNENDLIVDPTAMTMLWHIGQGQDEKLADYLMKQGIDFPETGARDLVADRKPWRDFSPSSGIDMNFGYRGNSAGTDYWGETFTCTVNKGNKSGVENENFKNCKYMTGTVFNLEKDTLKPDEVMGAMAAYAENHWYWFRDEVYIMGNADSCEHKLNITDQSQTYDKQGSHLKMTLEDVCKYKKTYGVLVVTPLPKEDQIRPMASDNLCQAMCDVSMMKPAVTEEHFYEEVNPDQDKSQLIDGDAEAEEEMVPEAEEAMALVEEQDADATGAPQAAPAEAPQVEPMAEAGAPMTAPAAVPEALEQ